MKNIKHDGRMEITKNAAVKYVILILV